MLPATTIELFTIKLSRRSALVAALDFDVCDWTFGVWYDRRYRHLGLCLGPLGFGFRLVLPL